MSRAKTNNENSKSMRKGNEKIAYQGKKKSGSQRENQESERKINTRVKI
jgi:hypothetical protein